MNKPRFYIILAIFIGLPFFVMASTADGAIDLTYKYAWSDRAGWINFGCDHCNVHITDSVVSGYVWSQNYGWINLSPSKSGVKNDGTGQLSGSAWGESMGWINFSNVKINAGQFTGIATGDVVGNLNFDSTRGNFGVKTDWRPSDARNKSNSNGGSGSGVTGGANPDGRGGGPDPVQQPVQLSGGQQSSLNKVLSTMFGHKWNARVENYWAAKFVSFNYSVSKLLKSMKTELAHSIVPAKTSPTTSVIITNSYGPTIKRLTTSPISFSDTVEPVIFPQAPTVTPTITPKNNQIVKQTVLCMVIRVISKIFSFSWLKFW